MTDITAKTKITPVTGYITPLGYQTRLRVQATTYSTHLASYGPQDKVEITEVLEYLENDPALAHVVKGDIWGKVAKINGVAVAQPAWMAIYYHGQGQICKTDYIVTDPNEPPPPDPEPQVKFPNMILVFDGNDKREYIPKAD